MVETVSKAADICVLAKDFVETAEGLVFAVVESGLEQGKVLCFLRYIKLNKQWNKLNTEQANQLLTDQYPHYLYYSLIKQAHCHALNLEDIVKYHQPKTRLKQLFLANDLDDVESDCASLCTLFQKQGLAIDQIGITGSILISAQKQSSDIDLVVYGREHFHAVRAIIRRLLAQQKLQPLAAVDWQSSYQRRDCDLSYETYVWHEQRKYNKALIHQRKFDLNLIVLEQAPDTTIYEKQGTLILQAQVLNADYAFDYPSRFLIQHPNITEVVCYTATYTGQAKAGEWVKVAGIVEQSINGDKRIVVGSNREARGEYIKVINA